MASGKRYEVYRGPSMIDGSPIIGIVTTGSKNRKTGPIAQLWILRSDVDPVTAVRRGLDCAICGNCPNRGTIDGKRRACYVNVSRAPMAVWKARNRSYRALPPSGLHIRLGAYGDPAALPYDVVATLALRAGRWTGYTHQYRTADQRFKNLCMASVQSPAEAIKARAMGWRSFVALPIGHDIPNKHTAIQCPADARGTLCADCMMCHGGTGTSVWIRAHGVGARFLTK